MRPERTEVDTPVVIATFFENPALYFNPSEKERQIHWRYFTVQLFSSLAGFIKLRQRFWGRAAWTLTVATCLHLLTSLIIIYFSLRWKKTTLHQCILSTCFIAFPVSTTFIYINYNRQRWHSSTDTHGWLQFWMEFFTLKLNILEVPGSGSSYNLTRLILSKILPASSPHWVLTVCF